MSKQSGLGWTTLDVDDAGGDPRDIRNDITSFDFSTPQNLQDVTGIDKFAMERLGLLLDFSISLNGVANFAENRSHDVFKSLAGVRTVALVIAGQTLDNEVLFENYQLSRSTSGELTWSTTGQLGDGTVPTWGTT